MGNFSHISSQGTQMTNLDTLVAELEGISAPNYSPSTNWAQGGPIIERERINVRHFRGGSLGPHWEAWIGGVAVFWDGSGDTPLEAAMRCYVKSKE